MSTNWPILTGKLRFSSLEGFLEHVGELKNKHGWTFEQIFSKGLDETLTIAHEVWKRFYSAGNVNNDQYSSIWAKYSLSPMPGCCGIIVSHDSWLHSDQRGKGLGAWFHKQRLTLMKILGYSCAICTVISDNEAEKRILTKNKWKHVHSFLNIRTGHTVEIWIKDL